MRIDREMRWGRGETGMSCGMPIHQRGTVATSTPPPRGYAGNCDFAFIRTQIQPFYGLGREVVHG